MARCTDAAKVYRDIADKIERDKETHTCVALWKHIQASGVDTGSSYMHPLYVGFAELFSPDGHRPHVAWWLPNEDEFDRKAWRILALCFMAAMVEAGDA